MSLLVSIEGIWAIAEADTMLEAELALELFCNSVIVAFKVAFWSPYAPISLKNFNNIKKFQNIIIKLNSFNCLRVPPSSKIFRFGQDLGSKFSDRELQNGHFGGNGLRGLTSLLERITEEGLSCLEKKNFWKFLQGLARILVPKSAISAIIVGGSL